MGFSMDISIVGAGVAGLWTALLCAKAGHHVHIFEAQSESLKEACSYRAGGMLAPFCEAESAEPEITTLGIRSIALWQDYFPDYIYQNGSLLVGYPRDYNMIKHFADTTENYEHCDRYKIAALEPELEGRFESGIFYPDEGHLEPRKLLPKLIEACRKAGVEFSFNTEFSCEKHRKGAEWLIDTRGLWAKNTDALRGVKGEMVIIRCPDITLHRPVRLLHLRHPLYIVPRPDHVFMIGATTIETETHDYVSLRSAGELLTQAYHLHPAFAEAEILEMNSGLRPAYEDNLPRIRCDHDKKNISLNGLYRHGWTIAPALAEKVQNLLR